MILHRINVLTHKELLVLVVHVRHVALSTVHAIKVRGHEDSWAARWAHLTQTLNLAIIGNLVQLQDTELHLLVHVLLLLWGGVRLLLTLLSSSEKPQAHVELRVVGDTALDKTGLVLELATSKENTLVLDVDSLAGGDLPLNVRDEGVRSEVQDLGTICSAKDESVIHCSWEIMTLGYRMRMAGMPGHANARCATEVGDGERPNADGEGQGDSTHQFSQRSA
jgi:hypothetical protein